MFDKRIFFALAFLSTLSLKAQFGDSFPVLKFDHDTVDFGEINEGDTYSYDFWFTNVGNKNMIIKQAYPACGCTYPTFTQGVIKPGERGKIHVEFHSQGWGGQTVLKEVIIILQNGPENYARFKATIINKAFQDELAQYKANTEKTKKTKREKRKKKKRKNSASS